MPRKVIQENMNGGDVFVFLLKFSWSDFSLSFLVKMLGKLAKLQAFCSVLRRVAVRAIGSWQLPTRRQGFWKMLGWDSFVLSPVEI